MFEKNKFSEKIKPALSAMYPDADAAEKRYADAVEAFFALYGETDEFSVFSVAGRSEICGNHTDHNHGQVVAASIDLDIIAVAKKADGTIIRVKSEGFNEDIVDISSLEPQENEKFRSSALIRGVCDGIIGSGGKAGGFCAYTTSQILKGSGLSSSAAFEDMIGTIENHLYNDGKFDFTQISIISQYAENKFFGKPCGLMDQIACAAGGFVHIDFADPKNPVTERIEFSPEKYGYSLYIVNTGGSHADLNDDYASVPAEMKAVAKFFGKEVLCGITEDELVESAKAIREDLGDRALLRALHFVRENERVKQISSYIASGDIKGFLSVINESGRSSAMLLQNYYSVKAPDEQGIGLACAIAESVMNGDGACRVHGGGFAGTAQVFVPADKEAAFVRAMECAFGAGCATKLMIRPMGAVKVY